VPKPEEVQDNVLREHLLKAQAGLRGGNPSESVKECASAFLRLLELKPDLLSEAAPGRRGQQIRTVMQFPRFGANLTLASLQAGKPEIVFERERFASSEAITYYEFTLETSIKHGA